MTRAQYYSINKVKKQIDSWLKDLTVSGAFKQYLLTNIVATDRFHLLTAKVITTLDALARLPNTKAPEQLEDGKAPDTDLPAEVRLYRASKETEEEEDTEGSSEDDNLLRQLCSGV